MYDFPVLLHAPKPKVAVIRNMFGREKWLLGGFSTGTLFDPL